MSGQQGRPARVPPTSKGAAYITDFLIQQRVPYIFGLCGHGILGLLDGLYDRQDEITTISVHHEAVAAFMADAYFRIAQRPVATYTSCGPGSANIVVAVAAAFADSSAMLNITGNVPTGQWNRGPFQETGRYFQGDFINVLRPYVKRSFQPTRPEMLPLALRQAFALMTNGRPGPVHVDVPLNVFVEPVDEAAAEREDWPEPRWARPAADPQAIAEAVRLLAEAERPVIVAGHGVELSNAEQALLAYAEAMAIPVATTPFGKGVLDARHPLSLGVTGRNGSYMLQTWGYASMGFGVAGPLGAKLAAPDRPVVTVCGDGGFVMNASAVLTAVEYDIPAVWIVWNNGGFSVIRDQQLGYFGQGRELATMFRGTSGTLVSADYAAMARSMGAQGSIVEKPADLAGQLDAAIASNRPTVLDVRVDPDIRPLATGSWDLPPLPHPMPNFGWHED